MKDFVLALVFMDEWTKLWDKDNSPGCHSVFFNLLVWTMIVMMAFWSLIVFMLLRLDIFSFFSERKKIIIEKEE